MTQTKHTLGPWELSQNAETAKNHAICAGAIVIAKVYGSGYPLDKGWAPESEANARLIASAPELLEALEELLPFCTDKSIQGINAKKFARAAIAKAEGK